MIKLVKFKMGKEYPNNPYEFTAHIGTPMVKITWIKDGQEAATYYDKKEVEIFFKEESWIKI